MADNPINSCLFCRIASGTLPAPRLYDDDTVMAFSDIHPQAPVHILVIPKVHIASTRETMAEHSELLGKLVVTAAKLAESKGLVNGYRLVFNTGPDGGQTVQHLHLHLLAGRPMSWPPG